MCGDGAQGRHDGHPLSVSRHGPKIVFFSAPDKSEVWGYKYYNNGERTVQTAWFRWELPGTVTFHCMMDDVYYAILKNGSVYTLQSFDTIFRYSKLTGLIDETDESILSNITTVQLRKSFLPTIGSSTKYSINFANALYNPHSGHNTSSGGILSSSGFKVDGDTTNVWFLDDDGNGNVRRYRMDGSVRSYANSTQGTINYSSGLVEVNSLNVSNIENIRGAASTVIEITVKPNSNDIVPIRNQVLDIDIANSSVTVEADTLVGGSANAGIGYTTTSSY